MAKVIHQATGCAVASPNEPLDDEGLLAVCAKAAAEIDSWQAEGKSLSEVALLVYMPLKKDRVSKAITAQYAAKLLETVTVTDEDLPAYITSAITYIAAAEDGATCE